MKTDSNISSFFKLSTNSSNKSISIAFYERITFDDGASAKEKKQAEKSLKELDAMLKELRDYANEIKHIAELKIDLDLDDGVKVNYEKFDKMLKKT